IFVAAYRSRMGIADYLALVRPRGGHGIEIVIVALAVLALPLLFSFVLAPALGVRFRWPTLPSPALSFFIGWIEGGLITVFLEELLFRGLLYRGLAASRIGIVGAIVVTSVMFAAFHFQLWFSNHDWWHWMSATRIFLVGLLLGWLRARTGSLLPGT